MSRVIGIQGNQLCQPVPGWIQISQVVETEACTIGGMAEALIVEGIGDRQLQRLLQTGDRCDVALGFTSLHQNPD